MATIAKCATVDCEHNEGGSCQLEEITMNSDYECDQANCVEGKEE